MKPENYSVKFQNSLADSRIIPGSQPGAKHGAKPSTPNGQRAMRQPTKAQIKKKSRITKKQKNLSSNSKLDAVKSSGAFAKLMEKTLELQEKRHVENQLVEEENSALEREHSTQS